MVKVFSPCDGFLLGTRYLLMDRDQKFTEAFRSILKPVSAASLPARSPNLLRTSSDSIAA